MRERISNYNPYRLLKISQCIYFLNKIIFIEIGEHVIVTKCTAT